jgi:hypothetical protein
MEMSSVFNEVQRSHQNYVASTHDESDESHKYISLSKRWSIFAVFAKLRIYRVLLTRLRDVRWRSRSAKIVPAPPPKPSWRYRRPRSIFIYGTRS